MKKWLFNLIGILIASSALAQNSATASFVHNGISRSYRIYVPAIYNGSQPVPLVFNLHGYTSNASQQEIYGNFRPIADTANFILVHPEGTVQPGTANTQFWNFGGLGSNVDDIGFLETLIDTVAAHYNIDRSRVYSAGMSNGGYMGYKLACESGQFAAIASVTGSMTVPMYNSCSPAKPLPIIEIHGTADATVPYDGNASSKPIEDVVNFWVNENDCVPTPSQTNVPNTNTGDGATAEHYLYSGGIGGNTVEHFKVINGGHTWPGSSITFLGVTCLDFDASKEIWRFFSQYSNPTASISESPTLHWNLYPNPARETVFVEVPNQFINEIQILDMQGRTVLEMRSPVITYVDVTSLRAGNYLIRAKGSDFSVSKKLVIHD